VVDQGLTLHVGALQRRGDGGGLDDAQQNRQIPGVLRNFAAPEFALFLQLLEVGEHHGHQLQDNGCRDIRHDAQRENCQAAEVAAAEQVKNTQDRALPLLKEALQHTRIDARRGNVRTDAVDREQRQGEQHPIPQIGDAEEISECFDESIHTVIFDRRNTATRACLCVLVDTAKAAARLPHSK